TTSRSRDAGTPVHPRACKAWSSPCRQLATSPLSSGRRLVRSVARKMKRKPVADQIVVVMGASSRIGRATALAFAREGARLVVSARAPRGLDSLVKEIQGFGGHALAVVAETRVLSHVHEVAEKAERQLGGLDTWVQAVALPTREPFEK